MPHPLPGPSPQPYPCAEDEECSTEEYCASPTRGGGAGAQICLACRKRRKRCMRHAMCCPGNYCKNGESCRSLTPSVLHLAFCGREETAPSFGNPVVPPANGCSAGKLSQKRWECFILEVVERLIFPRALGLLNRTACRRVNPSLNT